MPTTKHGYSRRNNQKSEYRTWVNLRSRCYNPKHISYKYYGARGITVSDRWLKFENFLEDMGHKPTEDHSINRIDNDGNYEPNNCEWATIEQQNNNRRSNHRVEALGETMTVAKWAKKHNLVPETILYRLKQGWAIDKAVSEPAMKMVKGWRPCSIEGCTNRYLARGYCNNHHQKWLRGTLAKGLYDSLKD